MTFAAPHIHILYGMASFGKGLMWNASSLIFLFFLTEVVHLKPDIAGLILGGSLLLNAIADVIVGRLMNGIVSSSYEAGKAQFYGSLMSAFTFSAFAFSGHIAKDWQQTYAVTTLILFRLTYAIFDVPHNAFFSLFATTDRERFRLSAIRYMAGGAAILVLTLLAAPWVRRVRPGPHANDDKGLIIGPDFFTLAIGLGLIAALSSYLLSRAEDQRQADIVDAGVARGLGPENAKAYAWLVAAMLTFSAASPFFDKLEPYYIAYAAPGEIALAFMFCVGLGKTVMQPLWIYLSTRMAVGPLYSGSTGLLALTCLGFFLFNQATPLASLLTGFAYGAAWGGVAMFKWGLLAKVVSDDPHRTTGRFGIFTFTSKLSQAVAVFGLGAALNHIDYRNLEASKFIIALMAFAPLTGAVIIFLLSLKISELLRFKKI